MNKTLRAVATVLWTGLLLGQPSWAGQVASEPASDALPTALIAHLAETRHLEGEFEQIRHVAVLAVPLHSSGIFRYQRAEGIVWRTTEPLTSEVRITPEDGVVAIDDAGHPQLIPASEIVAGVFLGIFSGDLDQLAEFFIVEAIPSEGGQQPSEDEPLADDSDWTLLLTPRLPALASQVSRITVAGSAQVERVHIHETNGDRSELVLRLRSDSESDHQWER